MLNPRWKVIYSSNESNLKCAILLEDEVSPAATVPRLQCEASHQRPEPLSSSLHPSDTLGRRCDPGYRSATCMYNSIQQLIDLFQLTFESKVFPEDLTQCGVTKQKHCQMPILRVTCHNCSPNYPQLQKKYTDLSFSILGIVVHVWDVCQLHHSAG